MNGLFLEAQKQNQLQSLEETMGKKYLKMDTERKLAAL